MKIYTKKGDQGNTSLLGGTRVPKYDLRIEAYGTVDELNALMGMLGDQPVLDFALESIRRIQNNLFLLGSHLANDPGSSRFALADFPEEEIIALEKQIDSWTEELPALTNFILPGGHSSNSISHLARCVCRRAERRAVELSHSSEVEAFIIKYLNRLSDWLFVLGRMVNHRQGVEEIIWKS